MPIPIAKEPGAHTRHFSDLEPCCFCHQPTAYWTELPERVPGEQVACCAGCAHIFPASRVPSKQEWFAYHAALSRTKVDR